MMVTTVTRMEVRSEMTEVILNITLEIIHLLTGEDYTVVKKKSGECVTPNSCPSLSGGWSRIQKPIMEEPSPQSVIHEKNNNEKILELTNKIIELLTGEVPIRCQDVTVHLSTEEWEYLEEHKDLYKDVMIENNQNLTSPGCLREDTSSHEEGSCFSGQSNDFSLSHLRNDLEKTTKDVTVCDGGRVNDISNYAPTDQEQHPSTHVLKEAISSDGGTRTDPNIYLSADDDQECPTPHIIEEPISCDEENLTEPEISTPSDPIQHDPSPYIKEEPDSCDEELSEPNSYTSTGRLQYPSPHIKEESVSCDEDLTQPNSYTFTGHLQYPSPHIKEEPVSCDEDFLEPNNCTPTDHLLYTSPHIKEESVSCDEDLMEPNNYTPPDHLQYPSHIKEEPVSCDEDLPEPNSHHYAYIKIEPSSPSGGDIIHADIYAPKHHTQYLSTHVKEEPMSCDGRNVTYFDSYTPTDHMQQHPTTHIKEEPVSSDMRDTKRYRIQYLPTHIKEDPFSRQGNAKFGQPEKDPITGQLGYPKETDRSTTTDHPQNVPSTCVKDEPSLGHTDVKTENSSSPMKVIVLAHLVDIDSSKPGSINHKHYNSQYEDCVASTSNRVKYVTFRSRSMKTPEAGQTFGDISNLTKYSRIHSKKKTLQCSECGQYFLRKIHLEAHVKMHAKQKSFQCSDCGKYFLDNVQLLDRKKDPGESESKCPVCRKHLDNQPDNFTFEKNPKVEKPFQCSECGKCFSIYYELFVHKKNHMEDSK